LFGTNDADGAWPIVDDELLRPVFRKFLRHQARDDVVGTTCGIADNDTSRLRRVILRMADYVCQGQQ
jgi:hypothetical protein